MEVMEKPPLGPEPPTLLKSYRWRTAAPMGAERGAGSPGSRRWARLQGWKRSYSHPEADGPNDGVGRGSSNVEAPKASTRRSLFQRAFSAPTKGAKESRAPEGGKAALQRYLCSMAKRKGHGESGNRAEKVPLDAAAVSTHGTSPALLAPAPNGPIWDVSHFSLVDGHLVLVGQDKEALCRSRNRMGSSMAESFNVHPAGGRRDPGAPHGRKPRLGAGRKRRVQRCHHFLPLLRLLMDPAVDERSTHSPGRSTESDPSQFHNVKGMLWKRLWDRKARGGGPGSDRVPSRCGSRESLLPAPSVAELDLNGDNVLVRPLHGSIVGERFCFQVITGEGSRSFGCTSLAERDRWIEELRRTAQPNKDSCERLELSLTLWVYEGRDLPPRRRLRCHLHLDGSLFARTTAKVAGPEGDLFWGELFQLGALPPTRALTLALCPDEDPTQPVASITVPLTELSSARQPLERWYPLGGPGERVPALRVRGRYREVRVLPIVRYKELAEFITFHYRELCAHLEPVIAARHKEELAGALVRVLQSTGKAKSFLIDLGVAELERFDDHEALIFRENTLATKAIDEYMKLVGGKYLQDTLGEAVAQLCTSEESCEVDPSRCGGLDLSDNQKNLRQVCEETFQRIAASCDTFPVELGEIFMAWREACVARGKEPIGHRLVSASLFLRFLCPAIMSPSLFGLIQEYPSEATSRTLTLVAKVIQNLANFTTFGEKEAYMGFMNEFLEHNWSTMTGFLQSVANPESSGHMATYDGYVDLALELATLHLLLCDIFSSLDQATQKELEPLPTILTAIRDGTPVPVSVRLSSTTERRPAESFKPGFVPPRDLGKHSPLIKSQSLLSIRRVRGQEEGPDPEPVPVPVPVPVPAPARERRNVQRTQSVPARSSGARRHQGSSAQHRAEPPAADPTGAVGPCDAPGDTRGETSTQWVSPVLQGRRKLRKSMVPWQRYVEEVAAVVAQGELYGIHPLEEPGRVLEVLRKEVEEKQEQARVLELRVAEMEAQLRGMEQEREQHREQLQRLRNQLEEANARAATLGARLTAAEGNRKKDLERLKSSEEKSRELERRVLALEQEQGQLQASITQALGHHRRVGHRVLGDDAQATSV